MMRQFGWHWLANSRELQYGSGGRTLGTWDVCHAPGTPVLCYTGLHWSPRIIDALNYAPGSIICRVETWGETVHDDDKSASEYRQIRWWIDAEMVLWSWACDTAEAALCAAGETDERSLSAIALRRDWLGGRVVSDQEWDAASSAARSVSHSMSHSMATYAEYSAARSAAYSVSRSAASYAATSAAYSAAYYAARATTHSAASSAASSAAYDAQDRSLESAIRAEARRLNIANWEE